MATSYQPLYGREFVAAVLADCDLYGMDVLAVLANALDEGISGAVGDDGTAYGPWQIHATDGRLQMFDGRGPFQVDVQEWAWSLEGVKYAVIQMAQSGARGLHGHAAVEHIVRYFEKPADIPGAISRRDAYYDRLRALGAGWPGYVARLAAGPAAAQAYPDPALIVTAAGATTTAGAAWRDAMRICENQLVNDTLEIKRVARRLPRLEPIPYTVATGGGGG